MGRTTAVHACNPDPIPFVMSDHAPVVTDGIELSQKLAVVGDGQELNSYVDKNSTHVRSLVWSILVWISLIWFLVAVLVNQAFWQSGISDSDVPTASSFEGYYSYYEVRQIMGNTGRSSGFCSGDIPFMCYGSLAFPFFGIAYLFESLFCVCDRCVKCKCGSSDSALCRQHQK